MIIAFPLAAAFVFVSGVRGVAWVSIIKDLLLLFAAIFISCCCLLQYLWGSRCLTSILAVLDRCLPPWRMLSLVT